MISAGCGRFARERDRRGFTTVELFIVVGTVLVLIGLMLPAVQAARQRARKVHCQNNLMQIALALQNYEMAFEVLPPGSVNATGPIVNRPSRSAYHVSWTLAILPQLELSNVYHHFDFRRGVYDKRNRAVLQQKCSVFECPEAGGMSYAGCHSGRETPIDVDNDGVLFLNSSVRLDEILDGCGATISIGEKARGSGIWGWTSGTRDTLRNTGFRLNTPDSAVLPGSVVVEDFTGRGGSDGWDTILNEAEAAGDDAATDPSLLAVGSFGSSHVGGAHFSFCDGAVRFISESIDRDVFRHLGSRNDGAMPGDF
jgi:competence protein ComGC